MAGLEARPPIGFAQPGREQEERARGERETGRHPHQQAGELLILERREAGRMLHEVRRIPHARRKRQQRAQHAAVNGGRKHVDDRRAVPGAAVSAVRDAPPEQRRGAEETEMLQRRARPRARARRRTAPADARSTARAPCRTNAAAGAVSTSSQRDRPLACDGDSRPRDEAGDGMAQSSAISGALTAIKRRGNDHQQLVLHHVRDQPVSLHSSSGGDSATTIASHPDANASASIGRMPRPYPACRHRRATPAP